MLEWTGEPYTLQQEETWNEFTPPMVAKAGELVCEARYLQPLKRAKNWYTHAGPEENTKVMLKHVVAADLLMLKEADDNMLPPGCNRTEAKKRNPV
mgnify:FL=1